MPTYHTTTWHTLPALALEDSALRLVIVPEMGAKIVSIFDKRHNHEWLVGPIRPPKPVPYASDFGQADMAGWDEMFPTIDACPYPGAGPYAGAPLPDHGEVWPLPWRMESASPNGLQYSIQGRSLPYTLRRNATLPEPGLIHLDYTLENTGPAPFDYLYAAHPQFSADTTTRILLPENVTQVINVHPQPAWGAAGLPYPWPVAHALDGQTYHLDQIAPATRHSCRKFYVPPETPISWAALQHQASGSTLRLEWHPAALPYLGVWVDEGRWNTAPTVALEPTNAYYDSLALAVTNRRTGQIAPGATQTWRLMLRLE
jgi:galactose mutarotase-like enzyme